MAYYPADRPEIAVHGLSNARPGLHAVGEYQTAGRPFLKTVLGASFHAHGTIVDATDTKLADGNVGNEIKVAFPAVTARLIITNNTNHPVAVYFCSLNVADAAPGAANSGVKVNHNYFVLPVASATTPLPTLDVRMKSRYVYIGGYATTPTSGYVSIAAELTGIGELYDTDADNIVGISG